jgi:AcrR family transcriptional regulator
VSLASPEPPPLDHRGNGGAALAEEGDDQARTPKGTRRRAAILSAAAELFRDQGFRATSLEEIGAAAGVSGPAIYRYFRSKHELLWILLEEAAITWRQTVDRVLSEDTPPEITLDRLIDAAIDRQLASGNLQIVYHQELRSLDDDARRRLARLDRVTVAEWVHLLCEVYPGLTEDEARAVVLMVDGQLRAISSVNTSLDRARLVRVMKEMALGGLAAVGHSRAGAGPDDQRRES